MLPWRAREYRWTTRIFEAFFITPVAFQQRCFDAHRLFTLFIIRTIDIGYIYAALFSSCPLFHVYFNDAAIAFSFLYRYTVRIRFHCLNIIFSFLFFVFFFVFFFFLFLHYSLPFISRLLRLTGWSAHSVTSQQQRETLIIVRDAEMNRDAQSEAGEREGSSSLSSYTASAFLLSFSEYRFSVYYAATYTYRDRETEKMPCQPQRHVITSAENTQNIDCGAFAFPPRHAFLPYYIHRKHTPPCRCPHIFLRSLFFAFLFTIHTIPNTRMSLMPRLLTPLLFFLLLCHAYQVFFSSLSFGEGGVSNYTRNTEGQ